MVPFQVESGDEHDVPSRLERRSAATRKAHAGATAADGLAARSGTERLTQGLAALLSRRSLAGVGAGVLVALGAETRIEAKKKKKKKTCPECQTCPTAARAVCPAGATVCVAGNRWGCGKDGCSCETGTSKTICAAGSVPSCQACDTDADCDGKTGAGSVCVAKRGTCTCGALEKFCVPPCANPLPATVG